MHTLRVTQRAGEDGTLQLSVPLLTPGSEYVVVVVVHPKEMEPAPAASDDLGCLPGYFENTFGSIANETSVGPSQGDMPKAADYPFAPLSEGVESVDWELQIESPPPRPSRTVMVKFEKGPCRPVRIVPDPEE